MPTAAIQEKLWQRQLATAQGADADAESDEEQGGTSRTSTESIMAGGLSPQMLAKQAGQKVGGILRRQMEEAKFSAFLIALAIAIFKDLVDLLTLGTLGWIINIFIVAILYAILSFQGLWFKRLLLKQLWKRVIGPAIAETIPFLSAFPWYSVSILLLHHDIRKRRKQYEKEYEEFQGQQKQLDERMKQSAPQEEETTAPQQEEVAGKQ